jgi:fructokinase
MTVMTEPASEVSRHAMATNASVAARAPRLTTFGTDPHGGAIDHPLMRCGAWVVQAGRPRTRGSATNAGRGGPATLRTTGGCAGRSATASRDVSIARIDEMISRSDIVKLSDEDLAWLRPGDRRSDAIRWLMSRGPAILIVTHGDTAATGYTRSGSVHVRGPRVMVADLAEWDDAFVDGLLQALTARDLPERGTDRGLRSIGLDDLRGILGDAELCAAQAVTGPAAQ